MQTLAVANCVHAEGYDSDRKVERESKMHQMNGSDRLTPFARRSSFETI